VRWHRPFQREYFSAPVTFFTGADGAVTSLEVRLRSDDARAVRVRPAGTPR
jgi:hypothetical protein